ncbi:hypothetical protein JCM17960_17090 [Magnetospira thiophila]
MGGRFPSESVAGFIGMRTDHIWIDRIRGANKVLKSNVVGAEITPTDAVDVYGTDSFDLGADTWGNFTNTSGRTYVGWTWKAGGAGAANTDGSISSTVSANTAAGFGIVSYTGNGTGGASVGHGLTSAPEFIIVKRRDGAIGWGIYHSAMGNTQGVSFSTIAPSTSSGWLNNTSPTSSVFTLGAGTDVNPNLGSMIAYAWHGVSGYSKFGSYVEVSSADRTFVLTGFKPAFVMVKNITTASNWHIWDSARGPNNVINATLEPNANTDEAGIGNYPIDFLSNGFKRAGRDCSDSFWRWISGASAGCRVVSPMRGLTQGGRSPTGVGPRIGSERHAATAWGWLSK